GANLSKCIEHPHPQGRVAHLFAGANRVKINVLKTIEVCADGWYRPCTLFHELLERALQLLDLLWRNAAGEEVRLPHTRDYFLRRRRRHGFWRGLSRRALPKRGRIGGDRWVRNRIHGNRRRSRDIPFSHHHKLRRQSGDGTAKGK